MKEPIVDDAVTDQEKSFPFEDLLKLDYFRKYRHAWYRYPEIRMHIPPRNYINLLRYLSEIKEYNGQHANAFAKNLRTAGSDWRNSEAVFSEIIVYRYYLRLVYEGIIRSLDFDRSECDVIVERLDGSKSYLEIFCVMPNLKRSTPDTVVVNKIGALTQEEFSSIRQKLLRKIQTQRQMSKSRENFAVIELNDVSIAGDFSVLSSLSSGWKIWIDRETMKGVDAGYDWRGSVFEDECTRHLKGIIYFDLGDYGSRRFLMNPYFQTT